MTTVKFRIDNCDIKLYKGTGNFHFMEVAEDFNEEISIKCTLEQLETLAKGLITYVEIERVKKLKETV